MKKIIMFIIVLGIGFQYAISQPIDKNECYRRLTDKYGKMSSVSFKFTSPDIPNYEGTLIAEKGNKYFINAKERIIVSNGEIMWNYDYTDNILLISYFTDGKTNPMALEGFFFNFLERYSPSEISESTSALGTKSYILSLTPKDEKTYDIEDIKIWLDPKNYVIKSLKLKVGRKIQTLNIENLEINKNYNDKTFEYKPTGKEKIVDFR